MKTMILVLFFISPLLFAKNRSALKRKKSSEVLFQRDWQKPLIEDFPQIVCEKGDYFRSCFNVSQSDCEAVVIREVKTCIKDLNVPTAFRGKSLDQEVQWAQKIGKCAGDLYEQNYKSQKVKNSKCRNTRKWL